MSEEKENFSFIEEKIIEHKRPKSKFQNSLEKTVIFAVVFGVVGSFVFSVSGVFFENLFQSGNNGQMISFAEKTIEPEITATPVPEKEQEEHKDRLPTITDFEKMYTLLGANIEEWNASIVGVSKVMEGADSFHNPLENEDFSYGAVIANNEKYLLILTNRNRIKGEEQVEVAFQDGTIVKGKIYGSDSATNLAIVAASLEKIPKKTLRQIKIMKLGTSDNLTIGTPLLALGSPNGYLYSSELGFLSAACREKSIVDYKVETFYTNMTHYKNGEGIVTNLRGELIGVITHDFSSAEEEQVHTFLGITKLKPMIENLVNKIEQTYTGVIASDITEKYRKKLEVTFGIYVTEVVSDSPAYDAGLQVGDVITEIEGQIVSSVSVYYNILSGYNAKDTVSVKVVRGTTGQKNEKTFDVVLEKRK